MDWFSVCLIIWYHLFFDVVPVFFEGFLHDPRLPSSAAFFSPLRKRSQRLQSVGRNTYPRRLERRCAMKCFINRSYIDRLGVTWRLLEIFQFPHPQFLKSSQQEKPVPFWCLAPDVSSRGCYTEDEECGECKPSHKTKVSYAPYSWVDIGSAFYSWLGI